MTHKRFKVLWITPAEHPLENSHRPGGFGEICLEIETSSEPASALRRLAEEAFDAAIVPLSPRGRVLGDGSPVMSMLAFVRSPRQSASQDVPAVADSLLYEGSGKQEDIEQWLLAAREGLQTVFPPVSPAGDSEAGLGTLARLAEPPLTEVTGQLYGTGSLRTSMPDVFEVLQVRFQALLEKALEAQAFKVELRVTEALRSMAQELARAMAGPRDVIELLSTTLVGQVGRATPQRAAAAVSCGYPMALELMGHVLAIYRNYALGWRGLAGGNGGPLSSVRSDDP